MTSEHFFRSDVSSTLLAVILFALFSIPLGYVLSWTTGLLNFRRLTLGWRLVVTIPVSLSACPVLAYSLDRLAGSVAVWLAFGLCTITFLILLVSDTHRGEIRLALPSRTSIPFLLLAAAWVALAFGSLVDLPLDDNRLYLSVTASDQSYRTAFTDAITRTSISHPVNPLGYLDGPAPLRYHYFWFILCSLVDRIGGALVLARHAFFASVIWCGIALGCVIAAYLRFFVRGGVTIPARWILKGILLLTVTGLDIIPTITLIHVENVRLTDMEAWNEAVTSWLGSLLWAPHSVGSMVAGLTGFLIVFHAPGLAQRRQRWTSAGVAGLLFATMVGDSIYVGFVFAVFLSAWTVITFLAGWRNHTWLLVFTGVVTAVFTLPYLISLAGPAGGGTFLHLTVRDFRGARAFGLPTAFPQMWQTYLFRLALLPLNYLLELGFFLIAGILYLNRVWLQRRFEPETVAGAAMVFTSITICTFLKSGVITNNDLGWRGFLPAQFMLLIWSVQLLLPQEETLTRTSRVNELLAPVLPILLVIGVVSTMYSAVTLRIVDILVDQGIEHPVGERNFSAHLAYERLRGILPETAILQQNPDLENPVYWGLYGNRQTAAAGHSCGVEFGGNRRRCDQLYAAVARLFQLEDSPDHVASICRVANIDVLVVTDEDPVWKISDSWVWKTTPIVAAGSARAFLMNPAKVPLVR